MFTGHDWPGERAHYIFIQSSVAASPDNISMSNPDRYQVSVNNYFFFCSVLF